MDRTRDIVYALSLHPGTVGLQLASALSIQRSCVVCSSAVQAADISGASNARIIRTDLRKLLTSMLLP